MFDANSEREQVWLASTKTEAENSKYQAAHSPLSRTRVQRRCADLRVSVSDTDYRSVDPDEIRSVREITRLGRSCVGDVQNG